ncbi:Mitochondrial coenzyme A transporter SLC25A42 [Symbiodinium microadriaticum]|uniref:Mitochondrial coenzyme A transporter SLC25A42 n=1 Tax=Symbiodinium microadriaticum TaxID=2951 RepID=A0A1Q9F6D2_SYMMI|nr:Mitochondrial coenzyme A transporter SLC25A42 [Symbiodinium microadriaticum]
MQGALQSRVVLIVLGIVPHAGTSFMVFETLKPWLQRSLQLRSERELPVRWRLAAGGVAGLVAQLTAYPLHVVRRRMQVQACMGRHSQYRSVLHALYTIVRTEGFMRGLYKGCSLTLVKGPLSAACGFAANDLLKGLLLGSAEDPERCPPGGWPDGCEVVRDPGKVLKKLTPLEHLISGGTAGAVAKTVIAPADRVKILYQTNSQRSFTWLGVRRTFLTIFRNTGVAGLWRGHCATLMQVVPKSATTYMTFDKYRHWISSTHAVDNVTARFLAGAAAGATATSLTYPLDMMRARMAAHWDMHPKYPNYFSAFEHILREEGLTSLYRGIRPTLVGIVPYDDVDDVVPTKFDRTVHVKTFYHLHWWGPLQRVLDLQQKQTREIKPDIVHVSSVLHSLATCLRQKGRFAVVPARAQKALEVGRKAFDEGKNVVTTDHDFNILLSSIFKLCYQIGDASSREWALEAWEWSSKQAFEKDGLTWQAYLSLSEHYGDVRLVDKLLTQGQSEGASWVRDPVALGSLLNAAANRCDAARAREIWDTFRLTGLRPNMICYAAYSKAHMLAGIPSKAVDILEEMERENVADMNSKLVVDCGQCLLIMYHSSRSELNQQRLLKFLARGDKIIEADERGNAKNEWRKIKKTANHLLADATALKLHDVLCEWKARTASLMKDWENFDAGTEYLRRRCEIAEA